MFSTGTTAVTPLGVFISVLRLTPAVFSVQGRVERGHFLYPSTNGFRPFLGVRKRERLSINRNPAVGAYAPNFIAIYYIKIIH